MWRTLCFYRNVLLDTAQCDQRVRDLPSDEPPLEDAPNHDDTDAGRDVDDLPYADDGVAAAGAAGASTGAGRDGGDLPYVGAGAAGAARGATTGARGGGRAGASAGAGGDVDDLPSVGAGTAGAAWWTTTGARGAAHAFAIDNIAISRNGSGAGACTCTTGAAPRSRLCVRGSAS